MVLSVLLALFVGVYAYRGWRRGLMVEVFELVGLIAAIVVASLAWPAILEVAHGWVAAGGGAAVFLVVYVAAVFGARWARRHTGGLPFRRLDGAGGTAFAAVWSVLLVTGMLLLVVAVPGARLRAARPVCEAPVGRLLVSDANPLHVGGERIAAFGRPVLLWLSQQLWDGFTLSHAEDVCDDLPVEVDLAAGDHGAFTFPPVQRPEIQVDATAETEILDLVNDARASAGLPPLEEDAALRSVGRAHARDMYLRGYFAHETPECDGATPDAVDDLRCTDPSLRMARAGIVYEVAGENLALAPSPARAHRGLMDSPGHRANILSGEYARVGIGVYRGPYGLMVTQQFAR